MSKALFTEKKVAYFDVRKFDERLPREQRAIVADTENITVTLVYNLSELPAQYRKEDGTPDEFVKVYKSREAKEHNEPADRAAVRFKVNQKCEWFNKYGEKTERPTNAWLEEHKLEVQISYNRKDRNPQKPTSPCGYWANGIMMREVGASMFEGMAFEQQEDPADDPQDEDKDNTQAQTNQAPAQNQQAAQGDNDDDDLPF